MKDYPTVSIIIPCLVREKDKHLRECLYSIFTSEYPKEKIQVLVKEGLPAEEAKGEALKEATGEYIMFLDTDNRLAPNYLVEAIKVLEEFHYAFGVEATYVKCGNSLNEFLTNILHISDPISLLITTSPCVSTQKECVSCTFTNGSFSYPLGANGFLYRKKDLDKVEASCDFEDTQIPLRMLKIGYLCWLRLKYDGIGHYYVDNLKEFFLKRRRQAFHYLVKREKGTNTINWTMLRPRQPIWLAWLYCITLIGPMITMVFNLPKTKLWLWWPPACFVSALGLVAGVITYWFSKLLPITETSLQPKRA